MPASRSTIVHWHFPLDETARRTFLPGGGIGITPMLAMAHRLHSLGADLVLHDPVRSRAEAGYLDDLAAAPWRDRVRLHVSDAGSRLDLRAALAGYRPGYHVYICGPAGYIAAAVAAAAAGGFPETACHREFFTAPETPVYENHPFTLRLARSGRDIQVPADCSAAEALAAAGVHVDLKCADGLCGVCQCRLIAGAVEHRDFVLSNKQRAQAIILCQSRAAAPGGRLDIDL